jgi:hypothetical protein
MEHQEYVNSIRQELEEIRLGAESYLQAACSLLEDAVKSYWRSPERDLFWSKLPEELKQTANSLARRVVTVVVKTGWTGQKFTSAHRRRPAGA